MGFFESSSESGPSNRPEVIDLPLPERGAGSAGPAPQADGQPLAFGEQDNAWESVEVKRGQTLDAIFRQQGFSIGLLHQILALNGETKGLTKIRPGDIFDFRRDENGELNQMRYALDERRYLLVHKAGDALETAPARRQPPPTFSARR